MDPSASTYAYGMTANPSHVRRPSLGACVVLARPGSGKHNPCSHSRTQAPRSSSWRPPGNTALHN